MLFRDKLAAVEALLSLYDFRCGSDKFPAEEGLSILDVPRANEVLDAVESVFEDEVSCDEDGLLARYGEFLDDEGPSFLDVPRVERVVDAVESVLKEEAACDEDVLLAA